MVVVIGGVVSVLVVVLLAYLVGRSTTQANDRMRGVSDDQRRADDGGTGHYSDYGSPMG
jgi:branched-subunit amino acid ABC-type transport system permease component